MRIRHNKGPAKKWQRYRKQQQRRKDNRNTTRSQIEGNGLKHWTQQKKTKRAESLVQKRKARLTHFKDALIRS